MTATYVRIDTIIEAGDGGLAQNGPCKDFLDFHYPHYNGGAEKLKGLPARACDGTGSHDYDKLSVRSGVNGGFIGLG